ncbi:DUF5011 domain-containing protein [Labilibacter sediminis]|nr:DUF5011 domain-containing protein [Labilibacter sediminis]
MKIKIFKYTAILACCFLVLSSCEKDYENFITKVTYYADIEYDPVVIVEKGGSYTASATATEAGVELEVIITGAEDVDVNTIGVYEVGYSAVNSDGYTGSVTQLVIVHNPNGSGADVAGKIYDIAHEPTTAGRNGEISLVAGTSNMWYCTDMGGSGILPVYFEMNGDDMNIVEQPWDYADVNGAEGIYDPVSRTFDITFSTGWNYVFAYVSE